MITNITLTPLTQSPQKPNPTTVKYVTTSSLTQSTKMLKIFEFLSLPPKSFHLKKNLATLSG